MNNIMKHQAIGIVILLAALGLHAEEAKTIEGQGWEACIPLPDLTNLATTEDGRRVQLWSDGTWTFLDEAYKQEVLGYRLELWHLLLAYFRNSQIEAKLFEAGLIYTGWNTVYSSTKGIYQEDVLITINQDLSLQTEINYRKCTSDMSLCVPFTLEQARKRAKLPFIGRDYKNFIAIENKLNTDLAWLSERYSKPTN